MNSPDASKKAGRSLKPVLRPPAWMKRLRARNGEKPQSGGDNAVVAERRDDLPRIAGPVSTSIREDTSESSVFARNARRSLFAFVILPALIYMAYAALFASRVYVSEFKLVVRSAERNEALKDGLSNLTRLARVESSGSHQDAQIVVSYIKSRAVIDDLGGRDVMERYYNRAETDFFSRLGKDEPIEDVLDYWLSRVTATIDAITGIVTVRVRAFTAQDAKAIADRIVANSERLINELSTRTRNDALSRAATEVDRSARALAEMRQELLEFRNRSGSIDPVDDVKSIGSVIVSLTLQKAELEAQAASVVGTLATNSVVERQRRSQIDSLNEKIEELKATLTSNDTKDAISQKLKEFEQIKLRVLFSEKIFELSQKEYEIARKDSMKQQLFVASIVAPTLADSYTYPKIVSESFLVFVVLLVGWGIIILLIGSILDHSY